jgi:hypothetical protein
MAKKKTSPFMVPFPDSWDSRSRIDLTFNLGSAIRYHREMTVPEIGGLRFVRQASWGVAGIQLAKSPENKKRYRAHEIANAIEALGSKIHFVFECNRDKEQYKYLGSRAFGNDWTSFSYQCLKKSSYYVQNTYRQAIVTALRPLRFCKGSSFFDQMELDRNGERLFKAFLGENKLSKCNVNKWLENWVFKNKNYSIGAESYQNVFSPTKASDEEKEIMRQSLDSLVSLKKDPKRRSRLIEIMQKFKPHNEQDLMRILSEKYEEGECHALQIQDAINFNKMREDAINLLQACAVVVKERNGRNGYPIDTCCKDFKVREKFDVLKKSCKIYLDALNGRDEKNEAPLKEAVIFAGKVDCEPLSFIEFLIKQESGIMDVANGNIIALSLFDKFLQRDENSGDNESNSENNEDLTISKSDSWKLPRLSQWQSLYDDSFGKEKI